MKSTIDLNQKDFYSSLLNRLVPKNHAYRKLQAAIAFEKLTEPLDLLYSSTGKPGESVLRGFKALLLQHWEDLSDRQLERYLGENNVAKWFCGYGLEENTPDHSYFGRLRERIGLEKLSELFNEVVNLLESRGYVGNVFHFVDASSLLSKVNVWEARDRAMGDRENDHKDSEGKPKMDNGNVSKYSSDPDARFGCKGKKNFWFGYKRHTRVDMREGMITKVVVSAANLNDGKAFVKEKLSPSQGMVFMDKAYDGEEVYRELEKNDCAAGVIQKRNRKEKNQDLDRWRSRIRMPFERVFSKQSCQARYRTKPKVQFQAYFQALVHNFKRLITIEGSLSAPTA